MLDLGLVRAGFDGGRGGRPPIASNFSVPQVLTNYMKINGLAIVSTENNILKNIEYKT